jgi:DUF4097 and DUF4098 domain-containing protein YvlB
MAVLALAVLVTVPGSESALAQEGARVDQKVDAGTKVTIRMHTGTLVVSGAETGNLVATAARGRGGELVPVLVTRDEATSTIVVSPDQARGGRDVYFEVKVPKGAVVQTIAAKSGDIQIADVDDALTVSTGSGNVSATRVGALEAKSGSGDVTAEQIPGTTKLVTGSGNVTATRTGALTVVTGSGDVRATDIDGSANIEDRSGTVHVSTVRGALFVKALSGDVFANGTTGSADLSVASGNVTIRDIGGDARVYTLSGDARIECIRGRVEASNASGNVTLVDVGGDVEVGTASGDLSFTGPIRSDGRYRMKTTSGNVTMMIQPTPPGFSVNLSSYSGEMETAFPIAIGSPAHQGPVNRKLVGRFGDGKAEIVLASFSGTVLLGKGAQGSNITCGEAK